MLANEQVSIVSKNMKCLEFLFFFFLSQVQLSFLTFWLSIDAFSFTIESRCKDSFREWELL